MKPLITFLLAAAIPFVNIADSSAQTIQSGPMLGYCEMTEVAIWLQTTEAANVVIEYWPTGSTEFRKTLGVRTGTDEAFVAEIICTNLEPGITYRYSIILDDDVVLLDGTEFTTQSLWQYRTEPPEFTMVVGSCTYINEEKYDRPGEGYGGDYEIFESIAKKNPDMMLWLGDNTYFRETDLQTWNGMLHRYTHTRSIPEMQKLLRACPHYAIWDDHDFGPNDSNGSWIHKDRSQKAFELFWANNSYGFGGDVCTAGAFTFGDVDVFLLDNRTFRTHPDRKDVTPQILGNDQISWLIESLQTSKAPFKLVAVGGQFISDFAKYETHAMFPEERDKILALLDTHNIEGVIVLTGDRHHTELSSLTFDDGRVVYDLTASPLTSTSYDHAHETNSNRVDGTIVGERNFVALSFSGDRKDRTLTMQCFNVGGKLMWSKEIKEGELRSNRE